MKTIKGLAICLLISSLSVACSSSPSKIADAKEKESNNNPYIALGVGYLQKGRLDLAKENLEHALDVDNNSADAHHYYAILQERLGENDKAANHFRKALKLDSKNSDLLNNYGSFLCKMGDLSGAESAFMAAVRDPLYKTPEFAYTNAGICINKSGNGMGEEYFRKALQANNQFPEALYQMAKLNQERGDFPKAQAFLYRYNESGPATAESLWLCTQIETALHEPEKAESCAVALRARFPDSELASQTK